MNYEFVRKAAPDIALPPRGQWVTPEPQGGITPPENLYGADGVTPLNYIQDQGGPRQFYTPEGTTPTVAPGMESVGARASAAPMPLRGASNPIEGIRGMQEPQPSRFSISAPPTPAPVGVEEPQNLMRRPPGPQPVPQQNYNGRAPANPAPSGTRPGSTTVPLTQSTTRGERQGTMRRVEPQGTSFPGILEEMGLNLPGSLGSAPAPRESNNIAIRNASRSQGSGAVTLEDVLRSLNFDFSGLPGPRRRFGSSNERPNSGQRVDIRIPDDQQVSIGEPRSDFGATGRVLQTSQRFRDGFVRPANAGQWEGRAPEIEDWARAGGIRLTRGAGYRTNNARQHGHPEGNSLDVPPDQLEAFIRRLNAHPEFRNIPRQQVYVPAGTDFGNGVRASGTHYHFDFGPVAER